ncbi:EF-P lysine aminoacylase EpmA [Salinibius halmophilus]|uniref:EF-P lysine aminoacylase EpmA n=1 Tax=Salinibius halmophilus TaxID=1853216 RepID=UPI000E66EBDB|nr:EF-P lysine aminoacylase EpmA [Salinibius halmophilus]
MNWQPTATRSALQHRQTVLRRVREYFYHQHVLEVETPLLMDQPVSDPFISSLKTNSGFLHTSPEYAMKRLLAAGYGDCWQYCKVFRGDERGQKHLPEFSMLEWYRVGFDLPMLIAEVIDLIRTAAQCHVAAVQRTYEQWFALATNGLNPHSATLAELQSLASEWIDVSDLDRNACLDILMTHVVEPSFDPAVISVVTDYPASQAALAVRSKDWQGHEVAQRFEVYWQGLELANGYLELTDADEQRARFEHDNEVRQQYQLPTVALDEKLLAAMAHGLPRSAGVALGFDRLLMAMLQASDIDQVVAFANR